VDRVGHQLLAGAALTAQQDGGVGRGYLADQATHLLHGPRIADDIGGVETLLQFRLQPLVLVHQVVPLHPSPPPGSHVLGNHGRDDGQQPDVGLQTVVVDVGTVGAERAHHLALQGDRYADEGTL